MKRRWADVAIAVVEGLRVSCSLGVLSRPVT